MRIASLSQASDQVLECRSMGHSWFHIDDEDIAYRSREVVRFTRIEGCSRCDSVRKRRFDLELMQIIKRSSKYANGYLLQKGSQRPTRVDAVRVAYRRNK